MDAPAHMVPGAPTLDQFDADRFVAPACVIDVAGAGHEVVGRDVLEAHADLVAGCRFVLLHTGWARYWNDERYLDHFPVLSKDAARWLTTRGLSGVGVDAISVDPVARGVAARFEGSEFANHVEFFRAGLVLVENLTGLDALLRRRFQFICLPLKFERADGSPVRAAAVLE
jgi:kynurenine formamidase